MKKYLFILITVVTGLAAAAQSIDAGRKAMYYEKWESAAASFREVIRQQPQNMEAHYWLMKTLLEQQKPDEAKQLIRTVAQQSPGLLKDHPILQVAEGELLLRDSTTAEAAARFEQALKDTKQKDPQILTAIARAYLDAKRTEYDYMLDLLDKAAKRDKNNPDIYTLQGDVYRRIGDGGKAVQAYTVALQKDPSYARADYSMGKIYLTQQNTQLFLHHFNSALQKDAAYRPALYELYYYYYFRDVNLAKDYLDKYIAASDPSPANDYMMTDLLFVSSKYAAALEKAKELLAKDTAQAQPRLYKLIAYSYDALNDSMQALDYIGKYFDRATDTQLVAKDYALRASLLQRFDGREQEALADLQKAVDMDTVAANKAEYLADLAAIHKKAGNKSEEAYWLGQLYRTKPDPTNLDLYYWGLAHYSAEEYVQADSVFGLYTQQYPDHIHGHYWRAKSNALIDTTMEQGLAVPHYQQVIALASADSVKNKSLLIQSYGYVGAYEANVQKDFETALENFNKILELDPGNADALRYSDILKKWVSEGSKKSGDKSGTDKPDDRKSGVEKTAADKTK